MVHVRLHDVNSQGDSSPQVWCKVRRQTVMTVSQLMGILWRSGKTGITQTITNSTAGKKRFRSLWDCNNHLVFHPQHPGPCSFHGQRFTSVYQPYPKEETELRAQREIIIGNLHIHSQTLDTSNRLNASARDKTERKKAHMIFYYSSLPFSSQYCAVPSSPQTKTVAGAAAEHHRGISTSETELNTQLLADVASSSSFSLFP